MEPSRSRTGEEYYLPHQAVIKESLNDTLMIGSTVQDGIFPVIVRFRCHNVVISGEVEKMYRQFLVHLEDRIFQKVLWRTNQAELLKTYQLRTITYGTAAALFLAIRCFHQLALEDGADFPRAAESMRNDMYVDDLLTGEKSAEGAKETQDLQDSSEHNMISLDPEKVTRTLGVSWNAKQDVLPFAVSNDSRSGERMTKRSIISRIVQLFDPLGLVSSVVVLAKILLQ